MATNIKRNTKQKPKPKPKSNIKQSMNLTVPPKPPQPIISNNIFKYPGIVIKFEQTDFNKIKYIYELPNSPNIYQIRAIKDNDLLKRLKYIDSHLFEDLDNYTFINFNKIVRLKISELTNTLHYIFNNFTNKIISFLENDSKLQIRLLSRDMDIFYLKIMSKIMYNKNLSQRLKLINLSRNLSKYLNNYNIYTILRLSNNEITNMSKVLFIDVGYFGTIPRRTYDVFHKILGNKFEWLYIWKSNKAPAYVKYVDLSYPKYIENKFPIFKNQEVHAVRKYSFRNAMIEYQSKWLGEISCLRKKPVYIMLDIDDTLLKDVDMVKYKNHERVYSIVYEPNLDNLNKYKNRIKLGATNDKNIHYCFIDDKTIRSYVTIRNSFIYFLDEFESAIDRNFIKLTITSANDFKRTEAIYKQLKIGNKTLEERKAILIRPELFHIGDKKDINKFRSSLNIDSDSPVIAIDDKSVNRYKPIDYVFRITSFSGENVIKYLDENKNIEAIISHETYAFKYISDTIYNCIFLYKNGSLRDRLIIIGNILNNHI